MTVYAIVILKNALYDLKSLYLQSTQERKVSKIYNEHKSFNLT